MKPPQAILLIILSLPSCVTRDKPTLCHRVTVGTGRCVMWMHGPEWRGEGKREGEE